MSCCSGGKRPGGDIRSAFAAVEADAKAALQRGDIRLLSMFELLRWRPERIWPRQEIEKESPGLFISCRRAAALLGKGERRVLVLSYGWGSPGNCDPSGKVLAHVVRFLEWLREEYGLSEAEQRDYAIFWDYPSLCQWPRTEAQDAAFKRALAVMLYLYASPLGTCVVQMLRMPPRPDSLSGALLVNDLKAAGPQGDDGDAAIRAALVGFQLDGVCRSGVNGWELHFATHPEAERAMETVVREWAAANGGWAALGYNDRPYQARGWCVVEDRVTREVVGRAHQPGFETVKEQIGNARISKVYDISDPHDASPAIPQAISAPQQPKEVLDAIEAAQFTGKGDKPMVKSMYSQFREQAFTVLNAEGRYVLYDDNCVADMRAELQRVDCVPGGGMPRRTRPVQMTAIDPKMRERMFRRACMWAGAGGALLHTLPAGLVQFTDYASDVLVIMQFEREGNHASFTAGVTFVAISVVAAWAVSFIVLEVESKATLKHWVIVCCLAPFNLHVVYLGAQYSVLMAEHHEAVDEYEREYREVIRPILSAPSGLSQEEYDTLKSSFKNAFKELEKRHSNTKEVRKTIRAFYITFVACKVVETAFESIGLSLLTAAELFGGAEGSSALLWSSLALSSLSMTYGFYGVCSESDRDDDEPPALAGHGFKAFVAFLIQVAWALAAFGSLWSVQSLPLAVQLGPLVAVVAVPMLLGITMAIYGFIDDEVGEAFGFAVLIVGASVPLGVLGLVVDPALQAAPMVRDAKAVDDGNKNLAILVDTVMSYVLPFCRHVFLASAAAVGLLAAGDDVDVRKVAALAVLGLANAAGTLWLFVTLRLWPYPRSALAFCQRLRPQLLQGRAGRPARQVHPAGGAEDVPAQAVGLPRIMPPQGGDAPRGDAAPSPERGAAIRLGYIGSLDMLDGILLASASGGDDGRAATQVLTRATVRDTCSRLRQALPTLPLEARERVAAALAAYLPSADGRAESLLVSQLRAEEAGADRAALGAAAAVVPPPPSEEERRARLQRCFHDDHRHPMRAVHLPFALQLDLWRSRPSMFGRTRVHSCYELSEAAEGADYFVSHASPDRGERKVAMMREFLCLQALFGRAFVTLPILAAFLVPLGFGLNGLDGWGGFPPYALSCVPASVLVCTVLWALLARLGALPAWATPWAFTPVRVWLDSCCLCQDSPETIDAGIDGLKTFLGKCDKMLAFVSPAYFRRLWTVYELATFCKANKERLTSKLLLLSLEWPSSLYPFKSAALTPREESWFREFSCTTAQCYKPGDRARLLALIREQWGSEEAFEQFVRNELPAVMRGGKETYQRRIRQVAYESLELLLGN